jgi:hypothetical protein
VVLLPAKFKQTEPETIMTKNLKNMFLTTALTLALGACGDEKTSRKPQGESTTPSSTIGNGGISSKDRLVPEATSINLADIGQPATDGLTLRGSQNAVVKEDCEMPEYLGVFGLSLGAACNTLKLTENALFGEGGDRTGDGEIDCSDYKSDEEDQGLLLALLCEPVIQSSPNLVSMRFDDPKNDHKIAVSFEDFDATDAITSIGDWNAVGSDAGRFPANIRYWVADAKSRGASKDLAGVAALKFPSSLVGSIAYDLNPVGKDFIGRADFSAQLDTSNCIANPSDKTCHYQKAALRETSEEAKDNNPGMQVIAYANNKRSPSFLIVEGKIQLTKETAASWFGSKSTQTQPEKDVIKNFLETREIYFRTVQKAGQLWGSFDFRNAEGKTIEAMATDENGKQVDVSAVMKNGTLNQEFGGFCVNLGSDDLTACRDIDPSKYEGMWVKDAGMPALTDDFKIDADFSGAPTKPGILTK